MCTCCPDTCGNSGTCDSDVNTATPGCVCVEGTTHIDPSDPLSQCGRCEDGWMKSAGTNGETDPCVRVEEECVSSRDAGLLVNESHLANRCVFQTPFCFLEGGVSQNSSLPCIHPEDFCGGGATNVSETIRQNKCVCLDGYLPGTTPEGEQDCRGCSDGSVLVSSNGECGALPPNCSPLNWISPPEAGCSCRALTGGCLGCAYGYNLTATGTCFRVPTLREAIDWDICRWPFGNAVLIEPEGGGGGGGDNSTRYWECECRNGYTSEHQWAPCGNCAPGYAPLPYEYNSVQVCAECTRECACSFTSPPSFEEHLFYEECSECESLLNRNIARVVVEVNESVPGSRVYSVIPLNRTYDMPEIMCGNCFSGFAARDTSNTSSICSPCPGVLFDGGGGAQNCQCLWDFERQAPLWSPSEGWAVDADGDGSCTVCAEGYSGPSCMPCIPSCPDGSNCVFNESSGDVMCDCGGAIREGPIYGSGSGCGVCKSGFATLSSDPLSGVCLPCDIDCGEASGRGFCSSPPSQCECRAESGFSEPVSGCLGCLAGFVPSIPVGSCVRCPLQCPMLTGQSDPNVTACLSPGVCDCVSINKQSELDSSSGIEVCEGCLDGFSGENCEIECPARCSGHGVCHPSGSCVCDFPYTGERCDACHAGYASDPDTLVCHTCAALACSFGAPCVFFPTIGENGSVGCDCSAVRRRTIRLRDAFYSCSETCVPPFAGVGCNSTATESYEDQNGSSVPLLPGSGPRFPLHVSSQTVGCPLDCGNGGICSVLLKGSDLDSLVVPRSASGDGIVPFSVETDDMITWVCSCPAGSINSNTSDNASPCRLCLYPREESKDRCVRCLETCLDGQFCGEDGKCHTNTAFQSVSAGYAFVVSSLQEGDTPLEEIAFGQEKGEEETWAAILDVVSWWYFLNTLNTFFVSIILARICCVPIFIRIRAWKTKERD